jgi:hypothetical protein
MHTTLLTLRTSLQANLIQVCVIGFIIDVSPNISFGGLGGIVGLLNLVVCDRLSFDDTSFSEYRIKWMT